MTRLLPFLLLASSVLGCAARKPAVGRVVVSRSCIVDIKVSDRTECSGTDIDHLHCSGLVLTKKPNCETFDVKKK